MKTVGIVCEYNPFHLGHGKQIQWIRRHFGGECRIVCLMSGNFVQRGAPAIFPKSLRARAAITAGADLVLELPVTYALSSAEGFAAGAIRILSGFCDCLCFGCESAGKELLTATARALLTPEFSAALRNQLDLGLSFPAARQKALECLGCDSRLLENPNDILAVEYCKAILAQNCAIEPLPIRRLGSYHANTPDPENPSATALRLTICRGEDWLPYVPADCREILKNAPIHTLEAGERAVLARLRTMTDAEFESLPHGSEGLWRKFMHACRRESSLEDILAATKSKRYTRTRLDRMAMCAFLGIPKALLEAPPPYTRVLALRDSGREVLKAARQTGEFLHAGEPAQHFYWALEQQCSDLYGLFRQDGPAPAGQALGERMFICK